MNDREVLPGGAIRIVDSYSSFYPIPVGEGNWILIDSGANKHAEGLLSFMTEQDVEEKNFVAGFLTHAHSDHTAGFKKFHDMPIYVGKCDYDVVVGNKRSQGFVPRLLDYYPGYLGAMIPGLNPSIILDGQEVEVGNSLITAISLEGHTDGSMGYLIENRESGDSIFHAGDAFDHTKKGKIRLPPRPVSANINASKRSIVYATRKIIDHGAEPRVVITSHSGHGHFSAMKRFSNMEASKRNIVN